MKKITIPKKREINPDAKRAAILKAATELFAKQGYEATPVSAIAAAADVAVGTVHRIFGDKAKLLLAAKTNIEWQLTHSMTVAWQRPGQLEGRFVFMLDALFDEMTKVNALMPVMGLKVEANGLSSEGQLIRQAIRVFMHDAMASGDFRQLPIDEAAEIAFGMVDSAMRDAARRNIEELRKIYVPLLAGMMTRALSAKS